MTVLLFLRRTHSPFNVKILAKVFFATVLDRQITVCSTVAASVQLTDLRLDVLHVLLSAERRLAHDALRPGAGRRPQEGVLAGAAGVYRQHVAARLRLVHPGDVVARAVFTEELGQTGSGSVRGRQEE